MARHRSYKADLLESLTDPREAAAYLDAALLEGRDVFLLAMRDVAEAHFGGMTGLSNETGLNREALYRTLSEDGNPRLESLTSLLQACGLRLTVSVPEESRQ